MPRPVLAVLSGFQRLYQTRKCAICTMLGSDCSYLYVHAPGLGNAAISSGLQNSSSFCLLPAHAMPRNNKAR